MPFSTHATWSRRAVSGRGQGDMYAPELTRGGVQVDQTLKESLLHTTVSQYRYPFFKKARVKRRAKHKSHAGFFKRGLFI